MNGEENLTSARQRVLQPMHALRDKQTLLMMQELPLLLLEL
jgi:hypothetical protein